MTQVEKDVRALERGLDDYESALLDLAFSRTHEAALKRKVGRLRRLLRRIAKPALDAA